MHPQSACRTGAETGGPATHQPSRPKPSFSGRWRSGAGECAPRVSACCGRRRDRAAGIGQTFQKLRPRPSCSPAKPQGNRRWRQVGKPHRQRLGLVRGQSGQPGPVVEPKLDPAQCAAMVMTGRLASVDASMSRWMVRGRTSISIACAGAVIRPRFRKKQKYMQKSGGADGLIPDRRCRD